MNTLERCNHTTHVAASPKTFSELRALNAKIAKLPDGLASLRDLHLYTSISF